MYTYVYTPFFLPRPEVAVSDGVDLPPPRRQSLFGGDTVGIMLLAVAARVLDDIVSERSHAHCESVQPSRSSR